jgi:hypothetical protein
VEPSPFYAHVFLLGSKRGNARHVVALLKRRRDALFCRCCFASRVATSFFRSIFFFEITHHMSNCVSRFGPGFAEFFCLPMNMFLPSVITYFLGTSAITLIVSILYSSIISNEINIYNIMTCYKLTISLKTDLRYQSVSLRCFKPEYKSTCKGPLNSPK